ncbi:MAG: hypothetical protein OEY11_15215 [Gammaproteobacteria bacterium]|nr:hypothetical protein [Gammaproteobacteria bacterium]
MIAIEVYRTPADFDCKTCKEKYCDETNPAPYVEEIPGVGEFNTCLLPMITAESHYFIKLYQHYKNGVLPMPGSLLQQPNAYIEAMDILDE